VLEHGRDAKIRVFKYKNKTRYRRLHGHRQDFTRLAIREIVIDGKPVKTEAEKAKPKRQARKRTPEGEAPMEATSIAEPPEPAAEEAVETAQASPPEPRRARASAAAADGEAKPQRTRARKAATPAEESPAEAAE
jgi:hypothetical protein